MITQEDVFATASRLETMDQCRGKSVPHSPFFLKGSQMLRALWSSLEMLRAERNAFARIIQLIDNRANLADEDNRRLTLERDNLLNLLKEVEPFIGNRAPFTSVGNATARGSSCQCFRSR